MSDLENGNNEPEVIDTVNVSQDEMVALKSRLDLMGVRYHPSIGLDKLREKLTNALSDNPVPDPDDAEPVQEDEDADEGDDLEEEEEETPVVSSIPKPSVQAAAVVAAAPEVKEAPVVNSQVMAPLPKPETKVERDARIRAEATRLVRINVTCMNPLKSEWEGEMFTVGNGVVGTLSKFVPFNTTDGWHVPYIIYQMIKDRQCQVFYSKKVGPGQPASRASKLIREFGVEIMDPLTEQELLELKQRQIMAAGGQE